MPDQPPGDTVTLHARSLLHRQDPRITQIEGHLAIELPTVSRDQLHYAAAVAVATLDSADSAPEERRSTTYTIGVVLGIALMVLIVAAAAGGVVALWQAVL